LQDNNDRSFGPDEPRRRLQPKTSDAPRNGPRPVRRHFRDNCQPSVAVPPPDALRAGRTESISGQALQEAGTEKGNP